VLLDRDLCDGLIIVVCLRGCVHDASIMRSSGTLRVVVPYKKSVV
jgi:hypothetical protein